MLLFSYRPKADINKFILDMEKSWKKAPWMVKVTFIYWVLPVLVITYFLIDYIIFFYTTDELAARFIPIEYLKAELETMPISTSIGFSLLIMMFLGAFYSWRLIKGSGLARSILEMFSWAFVIYSFITLVYPEIEYLEADIVDPEVLKYSSVSLFIEIAVLIIELLILLAIRTNKVKDYANII